MLFKMIELEKIKSGKITMAFRKWKKPTVKKGGTLNTTAGVLRINDLNIIESTQISAHEAIQAGFNSPESVTNHLNQFKTGTIYRIKFHW